MSRCRTLPDDSSVDDILLCELSDYLFESVDFFLSENIKKQSAVNLEQRGERVK